MPGTVSSAASHLVALHAGWLAGRLASRPERLRGCATSFPGAGTARPRLKLRAWRSCLSSRGRPSEESGAGPAEASASWAGMRAPECINIPWLTLQLVYCNSNYTQTHTRRHTKPLFPPPSSALPSPFARSGAARRVRLGGGGGRAASACACSWMARQHLLLQPAAPDRLSDRDPRRPVPTHRLAALRPLSGGGKEQPIGNGGVCV